MKSCHVFWYTANPLQTISCISKFKSVCEIEQTDILEDARILIDNHHYDIVVLEIMTSEDVSLIFHANQSINREAYLIVIVEKSINLAEASYKYEHKLHVNTILQKPLDSCDFGYINKLINTIKLNI